MVAILSWTFAWMGRMGLVLVTRGIKIQGRTANNTYAQIMYILGAVMRQLIRYSISAMRVKLLTCQYILSPGDHGKVFFGRSP